MKKFLLSMFAMLAVLYTSAQTIVTFDFSSASAYGFNDPAKGEFTQVENGDVIAKDGVTITTTFSEGNGIRFFTHSNTGVINLRAYVNAGFEIQAPEGSAITSIEIKGSNLGDSYVACDNYQNGKWDGNAASVPFTIKKSTVQINTITVTLDGEVIDPNQPIEIDGKGDGTVESPYDVARAWSIIDLGKYTSEAVYVAGTITEVSSVDTGSYGNATYTISDDTKSITIYRGYGLGNQKFATEDDLQEGDEVVVYGKLTNYNGAYEMTSGNYLYSLNGKTYTPPTEIPGTGEGTLESPFSVARALYYCTLSSTETYYVAGTISSLSDTYANNFNISDDGTQEGELQFYNGVGLEGSTIELGDVAVGDKVIVFGKLKIYSGTAELDKGCQIYSLNGETKKPEIPYEMVGDGSQENPYTVDDVKYLNTLEVGEEPVYVWVKGYILGSATSAAKLHEIEKRVDTNIAIAASADDTKFVPVALLADDVRNQLGVASHPENVGKEVVVYGTLEKYFSTAGVKNVSDYILEGVRYEPDGIEGVAANKANAAAYDLSGRRVNGAAKGLLIVGGKKVVK